MPYQDRHVDTVLPWDYATDENDVADASAPRPGNRRAIVAVAAFVLVAALLATLLAALQAG